jgi:penicillin-binding protein 1B
VDLVREQLGERYDARDLKTQNLAIYTIARLLAAGPGPVGAAVGPGARREDDPAQEQGGPLQGCLIALEPPTGAIVALVGGRSYGTQPVQPRRPRRGASREHVQAFVYLAAFEATFDDPSLPPITPATVGGRRSLDLLFGNKEYTPENYEGSYMGYVTLRKAPGLEASTTPP